VPAGHLAVTLTGPSALSINEKGVYTATAVNDGDADLHNVNLFLIAGRLTLSDGVGSPGGQLFVGGARANETFEVLTPGQTVKLQVSAVASSDQGGKVYQIISNDVSQIVQIHGAALVVDVTASVPINAIGSFRLQEVQTGQLVTYTNTVLANRGPDRATNVRLRMFLDFLTQLQFVSATLNGQPHQSKPGNRSAGGSPAGEFGCWRFANADGGDGDLPRPEPGTH